MKKEIMREETLPHKTKLKKDEPMDVEMELDKEKCKQNGDAQDNDTKKDTDLVTLEDIRDHVRHIEKAVSTKEARFMSRTLRALVATRRALNASVLTRAIAGYYPAGQAKQSVMLHYLDEPMDVDSLTVFRIRSGKALQQPTLPEVEIYLHLLVLLYLIDNKDYSQAVKCSDCLMERILSHNRRSLDMLAAKCYFYHARAYELTGQLDKVRKFLHAQLCTCTLRNDYEGQAILLNLLLRNFLHYKLYTQADKLVSKSTFPESASNNEWARYLYYIGRIKAVQLEYTEAHKNLVQALRKAPQHAGIGFKQTVQKLAVTVELLLGDIPDRSTFRQAHLRKPLVPYYQLTQAVRTGNLAEFNKVLETYESQFVKDDTYTLIVRLRHNVIKTGVRMISLSYLKISLPDVADKLLLDNRDDAEYIVAKAIYDGVIEATIDHENGFVQSKETLDIYSTREPMQAYHQRIAFCLDIHNQSVKAMRFPPKSYNKDLESAEDRREREQQELESAKEIAEDDFDGFP